jgi:hypothetical protein
VVVAELALDHVERHAFARHLDGVGVAKLMGRKATPNPGLAGDDLEAPANGRASPRSTGAVRATDAEERAHWKLMPKREPRAKLLPAPVVHADVPAPTALAAADEDRSASQI